MQGAPQGQAPDWVGFRNKYLQKVRLSELIRRWEDRRTHMHINVIAGNPNNAIPATFVQQDEQLDRTQDDLDSDRLRLRIIVPITSSLSTLTDLHLASCSAVLGGLWFSFGRYDGIRERMRSCSWRIARRSRQRPRERLPRRAQEMSNLHEPGKRSGERSCTSCARCSCLSRARCHGCPLLLSQTFAKL